MTEGKSLHHEVCSILCPCWSTVGSVSCLGLIRDCRAAVSFGLVREETLPLFPGANTVLFAASVVQNAAQPLDTSPAAGDKMDSIIGEDKNSSKRRKD